MTKGERYQLEMPNLIRLLEDAVDVAVDQRTVSHGGFGHEKDLFSLYLKLSLCLLLILHFYGISIRGSCHIDGSKCADWQRLK